jgi:V8-like Glu-specific endopeptidase
MEGFIMKFLISFLLLVLSYQSYAVDKVIYGVDNRLDIYESPSPLYKTLATSTAAMIANNQVELQADGSSNITGGTLTDEGICADARFAKQMVAANCSGFLVADNLLVTAGHCIQTMNDCGSYKWVFGFSNIDGEKSSFNIPAKDIYTCTKIISRTLDRATLNDYALVELDRKVVGRSPLKIRSSGKISKASRILVIGHPTGLPTKTSDGAFVRSNQNKYYFQANLDTFGGNSGSAVFNSKTGLVEGILVRGETDYEADPIQNCTRPKVCKMNACRGEDVTRITNIKELKTLTR